MAAQAVPALQTETQVQARGLGPTGRHLAPRWGRTPPRTPPHPTPPIAPGSAGLGLPRLRTAPAGNLLGTSEGPPVPPRPVATPASLARFARSARHRSTRGLRS